MAASAACVLAHAGSSGWNNATVTGNVVHPTLIRIEEHAMKLMLMKIDLVTHATVPRSDTDKLGSQSTASGRFVRRFFVTK